MTETNEPFESPFTDASLNIRVHQGRKAPEYWAEIESRTGWLAHEHGTWCNGWAVTWSSVHHDKVLATAIQVGSRFYFTPHQPSHRPGFKTFEEMRQAVRDMAAQ